ncbi:hypothetical protein P5719_011710, partial [Lactobacillus amylovorus]
PKPLTKRYLNHLLELMNLKSHIDVDYAKHLAIVEAESSDITPDNVNSMKYMLNIALPATMIYDIKINLAQADPQRELYLGIVNTADSYISIQANT